MLDADTLMYMKKQLHTRLGKKTTYHFSEIAKIVNELFDEVGKVAQAQAGDPVETAMQTTDKQFEELKKAEGIGQPPEPAKKPAK